MPLLENIWNAFSSNWVNWTFTTAVTLAGAYVGIRYQARRQASIDEKEIEQAKNEIINLMENRLINEKEISKTWMSNIISASAKKNDLNTLSEVSPVTLLQELMFEIEESSHLDPEQKERYVESIQETIENFESSQRMSEISDDYSTIIEDLRNSVNEENEEALATLQNLENKVIEEPPEKTTSKDTPPSIEQTLSAVVGALTASLMAYTLLEVVSIFDISLIGIISDGILITILLMPVLLALAMRIAKLSRKRRH